MVIPKEKQTMIMLGKIVHVERAPNSISGNPRFKIVVRTHPANEYVILWTSPDSDYSFSIQNHKDNNDWVFIETSVKSNLIESIELADEDPQYFGYEETYGPLDQTTLSKDYSMDLRDQLVKIMEQCTVDHRHQLVEANYHSVDKILLLLFEAGYMIKEI